MILSQTFNAWNNKITWSTKSKINKDKNAENVPPLETTAVISIHCNIANNDYQQDSGVLYTFLPKKWFGQLLDISPKSFNILKKIKKKT